MLVLAALFMVGCEGKLDDTTKAVPSGPFYIGAHLDWDETNVDAFTNLTGVKLAVVGDFFRVPLDAEEERRLKRLIDEAQQHQAIAFVTLEPHDGLEVVTPDVVRELAGLFRAANERGVDVIVRYAHEMNGSWYPWSQQPQEYVATFRMLAKEIHRNAPKTEMLWAPNYGGGHPFGGEFAAEPGSPQFAALDTTGDGSLTMEDDPYAPYYPGDDVVDWVGLSVYHVGDLSQSRENAPPEPGKFLAMVTGAKKSGSVAHSMLPDFHQEYAVERAKPFAVAETSAYFDRNRGGDELAVKRGWWQELFSSESMEALPHLRMVMWFEWAKHERNLGDAEVDWRVGHDSRIAISFGRHVEDWLRWRERRQVWRSGRGQILRRVGRPQVRWPRASRT